MLTVSQAYKNSGVCYAGYCVNTIGSQCFKYFIMSQLSTETVYAHGASEVI